MKYHDDDSTATNIYVHSVIKHHNKKNYWLHKERASMTPKITVPEYLLDKDLNDLTEDEVKLIMLDVNQRTSHQKQALKMDLENTKTRLKQLAIDLKITDEKLLRRIK